MIGADRLMEVAMKILDYSKPRAEYTELNLYTMELGLTRVADSAIHQNVSESEKKLVVRVMKDKKLGTASTNSFNESKFKKTIEEALERADYASSIEDFEPPKPYKTCSELFFESTANYTPKQKAETVNSVVEKTRLRVDGKFSTSVGEVVVANSAGTLAYANFSDANLSLILTNGITSGYANIANEDVSKLNLEEVVNEAASKCMQKEPIDLFEDREEKYFDVVLEPYAVADWLEYLAYLGLNALHYQENESFIERGDLGKKLFGSNITLWDDSLDIRGYRMPFDFEGTPKEKIVFVEEGVVKNLAYDSFLAKKENKSTTGHALPLENRDEGAIPLNLFLEGGEATMNELISSTELGIYITRFHYTNPADRKKVVLTGLTRDGTFLIENGKIKYPLVNLRYLQSVPEAFNRVTMLSRQRLIHDPYIYLPIPRSTVTPGLKIKHVRFIGSMRK
ncbi:MAG: TldD/PmbA family protein [Candidatus Aenigmarchaeota archaeon]|nr:TldD/PmbA family protein [Candidatus Aenigmarchaeota archaeon]